MNITESLNQDIPPQAQRQTLEQAAMAAHVRGSRTLGIFMVVTLGCIWSMAWLQADTALLWGLLYAEVVAVVVLTIFGPTLIAKYLTRFDARFRE